MRWVLGHATPPNHALMSRVIESSLDQSVVETIFMAPFDHRFLKRVRKAHPSIEFSSSLDVADLVQELGVQGLAKSSALGDMFALSSSSLLIHSGSNVAIAAKVFSDLRLEKSIRIDMGTNRSRLPVTIPLGTVLWPLFSSYRAIEDENIQGRRSTAADKIYT